MGDNWRMKFVKYITNLPNKRRTQFRENVVYVERCVLASKDVGHVHLRHAHAQTFRNIHFLLLESNEKLGRKSVIGWMCGEQWRKMNCVLSTARGLTSNGRIHLSSWFFYVFNYWKQLQTWITVSNSNTNSSQDNNLLQCFIGDAHSLFTSLSVMYWVSTQTFYVFKDI